MFHLTITALALVFVIQQAQAFDPCRNATYGSNHWWELTDQNRPYIRPRGYEINARHFATSTKSLRDENAGSCRPELS